MDVSDWATQTAVAAAAHLAVVANREAHVPPMKAMVATYKNLETNHNTTTPSVKGLP